jgi:hypothetical protein
MYVVKYVFFLRKCSIFALHLSFFIGRVSSGFLVQMSWRVFFPRLVIPHFFRRNDKE